jgi:hypothetical protein
VQRGKLAVGPTAVAAAAMRQDAAEIELHYTSTAAVQ